MLGPLLIITWTISFDSHIFYAEAKYLCPTDYKMAKSRDEHFCFLTQQTPTEGLNFEDARNFCNDIDEAILPIIDNDDISTAIGDLGVTTWIGIGCNSNGIVCNRVSNCSEMSQDKRFALVDVNQSGGRWRAFDQNTSFPNIVCARRAIKSVLSAWEIAGIVLAALFIFGVLIIIWVLSRRKILALQEAIEENIETENQNKKLSSVSAIRYSTMPSRRDEWEIERKYVCVDYSAKLGEGAFGSVYCVNIITCVSLSYPILLITEYCQDGDLLEFMRRSRMCMLETAENHDDKQIITANEQIMFAIQIAYGLEYISSRGFVHRDIAARNILVDGRGNCKIGDFGLCRAVGKEDDNYLAHGGKLPLKWMPPEAIENYQFSVASDVWSYGILLFEILTLGGVPYAGWPAAELLTRLKRGERMERPENCNAKMFEIALGCWADLPSKRPTFTEIRKRLGVILKDVQKNKRKLANNPFCKLIRTITT